MDDIERGLELSRLIQMQRKLKKAHPSMRARVGMRLDNLMSETAHRFLEVFGHDHPIIRSLEQASASLSRSAPTLLRPQPRSGIVQACVLFLFLRRHRSMRKE